MFINKTNKLQSNLKWNKAAYIDIKSHKAQSLKLIINLKQNTQ